MRSKIRQYVTNTKFKACISVLAAAVMYFTPDAVDNIIETLLAAYGITVLAIEEPRKH